MKPDIMRIRPVHDRVLVKRQESTHKTASVIVITDAVSEKPDTGEVIAIGAGAMLKDGEVRPLDVKVCSQALFGKYSGQIVKVSGEELPVVREEDIIAVL